MKILLETKDKGEVIKWIASLLTAKYEEYTSLIECKNDELREFILDHLEETLCDHHVHLGGGYVENIGNMLCKYIFRINCDDESVKEGTIQILQDTEYSKHFTDGWVNWSLWDEYDRCVEKACDNFIHNVYVHKHLLT